MRRYKNLIINNVQKNEQVFVLALVQRSKKAPVYEKYPGQSKPQPAYIEIDTESDTIRADWDGEIGNAVPADVWHGLRYRFRIPEDVSAKGLFDLGEDDKFVELLDSFIMSFDFYYDGSNNKGSWDYDLAHEIQLYINEFLQEYRLEVWEPEEWFEKDMDELKREALEMSKNEFVEANEYVDAGFWVDGIHRFLSDFWEDAKYGIN